MLVAEKVIEADEKLITLLLAVARSNAMNAP
jgi:hypothetical protein